MIGSHSLDEYEKRSKENNLSQTKDANPLLQTSLVRLAEVVPYIVNWMVWTGFFTDRVILSTMDVCGSALLLACSSFCEFFIGQQLKED